MGLEPVRVKERILSSAPQAIRRRHLQNHRGRMRRGERREKNAKLSGLIGRKEKAKRTGYQEEGPADLDKQQKEKGRSSLIKEEAAMAGKEQPKGNEENILEVNSNTTWVSVRRGL